MAQPQWVTDAGSLGTIPEGVFYSTPIEATAGVDPVYFRLIAGQLPDGIQVTTNGVVEGIPRNVINVRGVPTEVSEDVTSTFAVRAYTTRVVNGVIVVDRINDRTFSITVTGQDVPEFVTPAGNIGTFIDGVAVDIQLEVTDPDPNDRVKFSIMTGSLPSGLVLDPATGLISGIITPDLVPPISPVVDYEFTVKISDGKNEDVRAFEIRVYSRLTLTADDTFLTSDNTFLTADLTTEYTPILLNTPGVIGTFRSDNFFAYKFDAIDFNGDAVEFVSSFTLPPNLTLDSGSGWLYGYLADQGATEISYQFAVRVRKNNNIQFISDYYYFTINVVGNIDTEVSWLTDPNLGTINNGAVSTLRVLASYAGDLALQYRLVQGSNSRLPQGLTLQPNGDITGRVSFNTFALDGGTTTFDKNLNTRLDINETTFDMSFTFTVNAYAPLTNTTGYSIGSIVVTQGGEDYSGNVTVSISAPPASDYAVQATVGNVVVTDGVITSIAIDNQGQGYAAPPTVTIVDDTGSGAVAVAALSGTSPNAVSVFRTFTVTVIRAFNEPYEKLYIKCMPPQSDRDLVDQLTQNQDIIPVQYVYRADDPNFGVAQNVVYDHAYGLTAASLDLYVESLDINHYWKNIVLGPVRTARALDSDGNVLYEVVYSEIVDDLVNNQGESVGKQVTLPYPINQDDSTEIDVVYPNSLINMRDQVIDTVGQISPALPLWMTSKQENGRVLGFTPAWVICYTVPNASKRIAYNIAEQFGAHLNVIDFKVDRYEIDRSQTHNWDPEDDEWIPQPPAATTFDLLSRPSDLVDIGFVDYATTQAYVDLNWRTLTSIALRGGIDGVASTQLNNRTVIFKKQEGFANLTNQEAFTDYLYPYDNTDYDETGYTFDEAVTIPVNDRLSIYRMNIESDNTMRLTKITDVAVDDYVTIRYGDTFAGDQLYIPNAPTPGLLLRTWSFIPETPSTPTIFDGGSTRFISPADRWIATDEFDKYLVFPRTNILN